MEFPKIIHQIWLQGQNDIPDIYVKNIAKIIEYHSEWEYILWDEIRILNLIKNFGELVKTYYKLQYLHQKVDFARYIILYIYGGAYIDIDVDTVKSLDSLVEQFKTYDLIVSLMRLDKLESFIFCYNSQCVNNGIILAKPKNLSLLKVIEHINQNPNCSTISTKFSCINNTTGPYMFSNIILNQDLSKTKLLEYDYLEPCIIDNCNITDNTYLIHKQDGTWYSSSWRYLLNIYGKYGKSLLSFICCIVILIILSLFLCTYKSAITV